MTLGPGLRAQLLDDCRRRAPEEACGGLVGRLQEDGAQVLRCEPLENRAAQRTREYRIEPASLFALERRARAAGADVIGFYHSHPAGGAVPSPHDLLLAWPGYIYVIAGAAVTGETLAAWRLRDDRTGFDAVELCPS